MPDRRSSPPTASEPAASARARPRRPVLRAGVVALGRDDDAVQVGAPHRPGVVLHGLPPASLPWLRALDGTRTRAELLAAAPDAPVAAALDALDDAGLLGDAAAAGEFGRTVDATGEPDVAAAWEAARLGPDLAVADLLRPGAGAAALARRRAARVDVLGAGRLGTAVAALLAAAGVGHVLAADADPGPPVTPADVGPCGPSPARLGGPARAALEAEVRRHGAHRPGAAPPRADLVVVAGTPPSSTTDRLLGADLPHLLVSAAGTRARVGPLVLPGRGPCCRCLDLHRADRDPAWPRLAVQLAAGPPPPVDVGLATLAAALASLHAVAALERRDDDPAPPAVGAVWECDRADLAWRRRSWEAHPACGCGWDAAAG